MWLHLSKKRMQGLGKKLKPYRYGPFKIVQQVGENAFRLDLPPYMGIYFVVNSKNLKFFEPSMLDEDEEEGTILPSIEDLVQDAQSKLDHDTILQRKLRNTRRGEQEFLQVGVKGQIPTKAKWYRLEEVEENLSHLLPN